MRKHRRVLNYMSRELKPSGYAEAKYHPGIFLHIMSEHCRDEWKSARGTRMGYCIYKILRGVATMITPGYLEHAHHKSTTTVSKGRPRPMSEVAHLLNITTP